jgi:hypothetical protein
MFIWKYFRLSLTYSVALVRELTIQTDRPPPVGDVSANFCGYRGVAWSLRRMEKIILFFFMVYVGLVFCFYLSFSFFAIVYLNAIEQLYSDLHGKHLQRN